MEVTNTHDTIDSRDMMSKDEAFREYESALNELDTQYREGKEKAKALLRKHLETDREATIHQ